MENNKLYETSYSGDSSVDITMLGEHNVYKGHFPGNPITPGVMTLKMIRECIEKNVGRPLHYTSIKNCRFAAIIRPGDKLTLKTSITNDNEILSVKATLSDRDNSDNIRMQLDAEMQ